MCGWDLTKIRATRSTIMNSHEVNKRYQIACTWGGMMFVGVNPCSIEIIIFLLHLIYEKNYSLSLFLSKGHHGLHHAWATWASLSSCLPYSCSSPLSTVVCEFHFLIFLVTFFSLTFLLLFQDCILDVFKLTFLLFSMFLLLFQAHILDVFQAHILVVLPSRILVAPSSHSCCTS
jgi:hypothetical protein